MSDPQLMTVMSDEECWSKLTSARYGRLATCVAAGVDIFPINFICNGNTVVFRTAPGAKLASVVVANEVALELDHIAPPNAWSVVAKGTARMVDSLSEADAKEHIGLAPWVDTDKPVFVEIVIEQVSGRYFQLNQAAAVDADTV